MTEQTQEGSAMESQEEAAVKRWDKFKAMIAERQFVSDGLGI